MLLIKGVMKEKDKCIEDLQRKVKCLESDVAQLKLEKCQEVNQVKEDLTLEMEKKLAQRDMDHHDEMKERAIELKELQDQLSKTNENLDQARLESANKLEQQREEERILRETTVDNMNKEFQKKEKEFKRRLNNMDIRHKEKVEDLNKDMENALKHQKDQYNIKAKSMSNDHDKELEIVKKQLDDANKKLEAVSAEKVQEMFDHENEMKIHLADLQRHLEQRFSTEKDEKIMMLNKDFEMKIERKETEQEQQLSRIKFQNNMEEQKVLRANNLISELGNSEHYFDVLTTFCFREEDKNP